MTNNQPAPNNNVKYDPTEYKITCAGRGCNNLATYCLKIAIIKRIGDFCTNCKKQLEEEELVISRSTIALGIGKGKFVKANVDEKKLKKRKNKVESSSKL